MGGGREGKGCGHTLSTSLRAGCWGPYLYWSFKVLRIHTSTSDLLGSEVTGPRSNHAPWGHQDPLARDLLVTSGRAHGLGLGLGWERLCAPDITLWDKAFFSWGTVFPLFFLSPPSLPRLCLSGHRVSPCCSDRLASRTRVTGVCHHSHQQLQPPPAMCLPRAPSWPQSCLFLLPPPRR